MKRLLVSAVAAGALLGTVAQASPIIWQSAPLDAADSASFQNVNWYGWHHRYWRHHYWHRHYWHRW
jgi:hypothetical protein